MTDAANLKPGRHTGPAPSRNGPGDAVPTPGAGLGGAGPCSCSSPAWSGAARCIAAPGRQRRRRPPPARSTNRPRRLHRALSLSRQSSRCPTCRSSPPSNLHPSRIIKVEAPPAPSPAPVVAPLFNAPRLRPPSAPVHQHRHQHRHRHRHRHRHWRCRRHKTASLARFFRRMPTPPTGPWLPRSTTCASAPARWPRCANCKPVKTVCLSQLNISPRDFREGFPGMDRIEWFGLDIRFTVDMPQDMTRDILLLSDDGSSLSASTASRCSTTTASMPRWR